VDYNLILKTAGIKITPHKIAILSLFHQRKHLNANEIVHILTNKKINISIATVYRILASFEAHKLVNKHNFGDDQAIYELYEAEEHHDHLICIKCGLVVEFSNQEMEDLQKSIAQKNNFIILRHSLIIYGNCDRCNQTN
jgi:Fur family ferric uptake transcriptional regulator